MEKTKKTIGEAALECFIDKEFSTGEYGEVRTILRKVLDQYFVRISFPDREDAEAYFEALKAEANL